MISKAEHDAAMREKEGQLNALRHELDQLKRLIFGTSSERFVPASPPEQLALWNSGSATAPAQEEAAKENISYERRKPRRQPHPGRTPLPEHLPVRREVIEPAEDTTGLVKIGEDVTRKVDYRPGKLEVIEYVRPRYARAEAEPTEDRGPVVQAPAPDQVLPKAIAGVGLLVQIIIAKFIDHLPLYRQRQMLRRDYDWEVPASTLGDWFAATCALLEPLYRALQKSVLDTDYLQGDESRITVLQKGKEPTKNKSHRFPPKDRKVHLGYMWVFRNPLTAQVLFVYRSGRGANVLHETLGAFAGHLQSDGYSAYTSYLKKHAGVELVSCLAHIRRKFFDARSNHLELAETALRAIQYLYRIEAIARDYELDAEARRRLRDRYARPAYEAFVQWVDHHQRNNLGSGAIGKALGYANNHLPRLRPYLDDGRIEIDNNQIENQIRPLALGRKNYLFAGSNQGAQRAAMMYSFFASCKEYQVNPREWLTDVLRRIADHPINRIAELLPQAWAEARRPVAGKE